MQQRGSRTSSSTGNSPTVSSIGAALLMLRLLILPGSLNATSSRALRGGLSRCVSPAGLPTEKSGQDRRRANRSRTPVSSLPPVMNGIYGPTYFASSVPEGPLRSLESRLRQRLGLIGSTECSLTWKEATTPAGRSYSRLAPSTPRTVEIVSTSPHATHTHTHTHTHSRTLLLDHGHDARLEGQSGDERRPTGWTFEGRPVAEAGDGCYVGDVDFFAELERGLAAIRAEGSGEASPERQVHTYDADSSIAPADDDGFGEQVPAAREQSAIQVARCDLDIDRPWSSTTFIIGHDGKARRVEPSIRLLADGVPGRVGRLRAYGNAIVPQLAAQVIRSYMETQP